MPRRQATLRRRAYNTRTSTIFLVACEGRTTEKIYFEFINQLIVATNPDFNFRVKALPVGSGPQGVLDAIQDYTAQNGITEEDHSWLVIDVDHHISGTNRQILNEVVRRATSFHHRLAISNACFEVWIILHLTEQIGLIPSTQMERAVRQIWPEYNKSNYDASCLAPNIGNAIDRAKRRDTAPDEPVPEQSGTRVYQLMETLRDCIERAGGRSPF